MIKVCPICGKEFETNTNCKKFCSSECHKKHDKEQHKEWYEKNKDDYNVRRRLGEHCEYKRTCPVCGIKFTSSQPKAVYCSVECRRKDNKVNIPERTCVVCGKTYKPSRKDQKCCSSTCSEEYKKNYEEYNKKPKICPNCGKEFHISNRKYCCIECQKEAEEKQHREYYENNKDKIREYYEVNKEKKKEYSKKYWETHRQLKPWITKTCIICGKEFKTKRDDILCCSPECSKENDRANAKSYYENNKDKYMTYWEKRKKKEAEKRVTYNKVCPICGTPFTTNLSNKIYCCKKCNKESISRRDKEKRANTVKEVKTYTGICPICNRTFEAPRKGVKYCSKECKKEALRLRNLSSKYKEQRRAYEEKNKDKIRERMKKYRKEYYKNNRDKVNAHRRERIKTDINFKIQDWCRGQVRRCLYGKRKNQRTFDILGYTPEQLRARIESQFVPGMSWENHGEWHIDHRKPLALFNLVDKEGNMLYRQIRLANSLANLKPIWKEENFFKHDKIEGSY